MMLLKYPNISNMISIKLINSQEQSNIFINYISVKKTNHNLMISGPLQENTHQRFACTPNMNAELTQEHTKTGESCTKA
jgi:hypothetical protein